MSLKFTMKSLLSASTVLVGFNAVAAYGAETQSILTTQMPVAQNFVQMEAAQTQSAINLSSQYNVFAPKRQTASSVIDYQIMDDALKNIVVRLGQSVRIRASRPEPTVGTRRVQGHKSAYRLEGSRVTFSYLNDEYREGLTAYRKDLERIANEVDISRLGKKEQLVFWFNLHNIALIEQIALNYPVRRPSKLKIGANKQSLHDAKLLNIRGVALSLRDIRENIVYANWNSPDVIYGFFHGNIGGPALQNYAFSSNNLDYVLELQANEFVNSLRGFHESRSVLKISTLYEEARVYYFPNWEADLKTHLRTHADPKVLKELESNKPFKFDRYDPIVADLLAGDRPSISKLNVTINGYSQSARMAPEIARLFRELDQKTRIMKKRGMIQKGGGTVTIEDIETIDVDIPDVEEGK